MPRRKKPELAASRSQPLSISTGVPASGDVGVTTGEVTGRYIVTFKEGAEKECMSLLSRRAGVTRLASSADFKEKGVEIKSADAKDGVVFEKLGVAVVSAEPDALSEVASAAGETDSAILAVEPERIMYALGTTTDVDVAEPPARTSIEYMRGYRDAVVSFFSHVAGGQPTLEALEPEEIFADSDTATWGLQATNVINATATGRGISVAILDTGLDLGHPDFAGRAISRRSFIPGESPQDGHGHGTHCTGTACGTNRPGVGPRYGIAYNSRIFAGKVLSNAGSGPDMGILAGIDWAIRNRCQVVSMSLGAQAPPSPAYETVGTRALAQGTLIIAAAGNDSDRSQGLIRPVGRPANSPSIMAVAALTPRLGIASFSNRGSTSGGGQIDIAGPGVGVLSSVPMPARTRKFNGTSMATPHVAGIAALFAEQAGVRGAALWRLILAKARRLVLPSRDVGAGLVRI